MTTTTDTETAEAAEVAAEVIPAHRDVGYHISQADAKDPAQYRRAKELAAQAGQSLIIDPPDAPAARTYAPSTVLIPRGASPAEYRAAKARAEAAGLPYAIQE